MKFCIECGSKLAGEAVFCPNCGAKQATKEKTGVVPIVESRDEEKIVVKKKPRVLKKLVPVVILLAIVGVIFKLTTDRTLFGAWEVYEVDGIPIEKSEVSATFNKIVVEIRKDNKIKISFHDEFPSTLCFEGDLTRKKDTELVSKLKYITSTISLQEVNEHNKQLGQETYLSFEEMKKDVQDYFEDTALEVNEKKETIDFVDVDLLETFVEVRNKEMSKDNIEFKMLIGDSDSIEGEVMISAKKIK